MKDINVERPSVLLIGIGNCARGDDGLGWKFVEMIEACGYTFVECEYRYQLQVEDADFVAEFDVVVFVDAAKSLDITAFQLTPCIAAPHYVFSSHSQHASTIVYLANTLYNKYPKAYLLAISGNSWELGSAISDVSEANLRSALSYFNEQFLPSLNKEVLMRV